MTARIRRRSGLPANRRSPRAKIVLAVVGLIFAVAVGEVVADVVNSAGPATLLQQRSYVAAVVPLIDESTALVPWLTDVRNRAPELGRNGLYVALSRLVSGSVDVEQQLSSVGIPAPSGRSARLLGEVFRQRVLAARTLTSAVTLALTSGDSSRALASMQGAAGDVQRSDSYYTAFITSVPLKAKEHTPALPTSSWASSVKWTKPVLQAYVTTLGSDSALRLTHDLTILALAIQPPALRITPTTTTSTTTTTTSTTTTATSSTTTTTTVVGASTTSTLPPTSTTTSTSTSTTTTTLQVPPSNSTSWLAPTTNLTAIVVVANGGNVTEHQVTVRATLTPVAPPSSGSQAHSTTTTTRPAPQLRTETVRHPIGTFAAGASLEFDMPSFTVRPGTLYLLTVTIQAPGNASGMTDSKTVRIDVTG
ncbi:MAG: hypothetical protein ACLPYW_07940 [Acidimicrobiales bacterium]